MGPDDFASFYTAVHGFDPFPWQVRLAGKTISGNWPDVISLPTASGKTSVIDIAVFALAVQADLPAVERTAPLRVFFTIDRRLVVDEVTAHAERLADALDSGSGIVGEVARRLTLFGGPRPLQVARLRGGVYRDDVWTERPNQPTVCVTTVDQVGSRLLFRGYGLSGNQAPVHAGLVANDALIIVDEAHLSQPFIETVSAVRKYRGWGKEPVSVPTDLVVMSATPRAAGSVFELDESDRKHSVLSPRLRAEKGAQLLEQRAEDFEDTMADCALALSRTAGTEVVGVVVNRVASARAIFERLRVAADAVLLTGRVRPFDRDRLLSDWLPRIQAGRDRLSDKPFFVVATQTIEVGANIDFDALVTEAAPLDALRQRFGRLDRLGRRGENEAVIMYRKPEGREPDPIYGSDLLTTWKWLRAHASGKGKRRSIDFGVAALDALLQSAGDVPGTTARHAPVMLPAHVRFWAQTNPRPHPDPDVALFLHGPESASADMQIVWRADLDEDQQESWAATVALVPPRLRETMSVPAGAVRSWLNGQVAPVADVEGVGEGAQDRSGPRGRKVLRWRGPEDSELITSDTIVPGDTIVVPAAWGGADRFGWDPKCRNPVADIADLCAIELALSTPSARRPYRVRLHAALLDNYTATTRTEPPPEINRQLASLLNSLAQPESDEDTTQMARELLRTAADELAIDPALKEVFTALSSRSVRILQYAGRRPQGIVMATGIAVGFTDEDDTASLTCPVVLQEHISGVAAWARRFADGCGLHTSLAADIELAGYCHDLGKADPRFQIMLHGGDELASASAQAPLAKSGMDPTDAVAMRFAWERSGLPRGFRHELVSVALIESQEKLLSKAHDPDLVKVLVGTHHGRARPFAPVIDDQEPEMVEVACLGHACRASSNHGFGSLERGWVDLFWNVVDRYGAWGLAYCEAILRLADRARSKEERDQCLK